MLSVNNFPHLYSLVSLWIRLDYRDSRPMSASTSGVRAVSAQGSHPIMLQYPALEFGLILAVISSDDCLLWWNGSPAATLRWNRWSQHVHDEVVQLVQHHEVNGQTWPTVLRCWVTCQPGEGVVLLQHKSVQDTERHFLFKLVINNMKRCFLYKIITHKINLNLDDIHSEYSNKTLPQYIWSLIGVKGVGVFAVQKFIWLHWRHVEVQRSLRDTWAHARYC